MLPKFHLFKFRKGLVNLFGKYFYFWLKISYLCVLDCMLPGVSSSVVMCLGVYPAMWSSFLKLVVARFNNTKYPQQLLSKSWPSFGDEFRILGIDIYWSRPLNWHNHFDQTTLNPSTRLLLYLAQQLFTQALVSYL